MHRHLFAVLLLSASCHALAADFSGTYQCQLSDHRDGPFDGTLILKRDEQATMRHTGYGSYRIDLKVKGIPYTYTGIAAARGNDLAIYFESVGEKRDADDRGVGIASVILDQDKKGNNTVSIHKFYYEKSYKGASNYGFEWCTKVK